MTHRMIWRIVILFGLVLAACGDSTSGALAAETDPQVAMSEDEDETPAVEHPGAAVFQLDPVCRNRGTVDGLDSSWRFVDGVLPDEWRGREAVDGILRHSQDGWATFTDDEFNVIEVTNFGSVQGGCAAWPAVKGDGVVAELAVDDECSNGSSVVEAFGVAWGLRSNVADPLPVEWRFLGTVDGVLHFESFESSYFEADGRRFRVAATGVEFGASCEGWPFSWVSFYDYEVEDGQTLALLLDVCEPSGIEVDVNETAEAIKITITEAVFEGASRPDCSDVLRVVLEQPLDGRDVVDGTTGEIVAES